MIFSKKVFFTYNNNIFPKNKSFAELFNWQKYTAVSKIKKHQNIVLKIQTRVTKCLILEKVIEGSLITLYNYVWFFNAIY